MSKMSFSYDMVSGTLVNYYSHCPRQAWLFNAGLHVENFSDSVKKGKWVDENTFKRGKEFEIMGERIKADFIVENKTPIELHEIKASKVIRQDHRLQVAFYLLKLKEKGLDAVGIIHYPQLNKVEKVSLENMLHQIKRTVDDIVKTMNGECPARLDSKYCRGCAYYEFCYSIEVR